MTFKEALQIMDLAANHSKADLKRAFRQAQMVWHPDRFEGNPELQKKAQDKTYLVNEAFELLSRTLENQDTSQDGGAGLKEEPATTKDTDHKPEPTAPRRATSYTSTKPEILHGRPSLWKWYICGLLLLATMINYMDRQTLSNAAAAVKAEFRLDDLQYGNLETAFGLAFGVGSLVFGFLCERFSLRWMYPVVLGGWSLAGLFSSWAADYHQFMTARVMLGLFEAGHWPCALKTTFRLLQPNERMMGNSVLQSGASIGAIITPRLVLWLSDGHPQGWRFAFQVIALTGVVWIVLWLASFRLQTTAASGKEGNEAGERDSVSLMPIIVSKKFWAIALLLVGIQIPWQIIRAWLPLFLQQGRGYDALSTANFVSIYYIATDVGCILAGVLSLQLVKRFSLSNHVAKRRIFDTAALLASLTICIPWLGKSPLLLGLLLVVGAASLAMFPCYYSFVQELSAEHVSRLTGLFSMWVWITTSPLQSLFGWLRVKLGSYDPALALTGLTPWLGVIAMKLLWDRQKEDNMDTGTR